MYAMIMWHWHCSVLFLYKQKMLSPADCVTFLFLEGDVEEIGEITDADSSQSVSRFQEKEKGGK